MAGDLLGGLGEKPSCVGITRLGHRAMVAVLCGLADTGNKPEIARSVIGVTEATPVAQSGDDRLGDGRADAGQCHDEPNVLPWIADLGELDGELCLFGFEMNEQLHVAVDHQAIAGSKARPSSH